MPPEGWSGCHWLGTPKMPPTAVPPTPRTGAIRQGLHGVPSSKPFPQAYPPHRPHPTSQHGLGAQPSQPWRTAVKPSVCPGRCLGPQPLSISLQLKASQCLSGLREEMQRQGSSTASGEARGARGTRDKVDEAPPLVTKVPCLTKPPSSYLQPSLFSFSDSLSSPPPWPPYLNSCPCSPHSHSLQGCRNAHPRSHSLVPGPNENLSAILARDSKFHSKVKSKLTYRLHLCSCGVNCCCP
jgi:hypothetical protein